MAKIALVSVNGIHQKAGILLFLFLFLSGCGWGWQRYNNRECKFSILLPSSWQKQEGVYNTIVIAKAPLISNTDRFQENITITVTELPKKIDLFTYFEFNKDALMQHTSMADISEGDIFAGFLAGKWLSFEGKMHDLSLKIISAVWIKDNRVYGVTCSSQVKDFAKYAPIFNKIMRSLRVN